MSIHSFRGEQFEVVAGPEDFSDECDVRDRWWDPRPGQIVVDVGAGRGSYALTALACGATVFAFSPDPGDTEILKQNILANPRHAGRCFIIRRGLHDLPGWLHVGETPAGARYLFTPEEPEAEIKIPVGPLDGDDVAALPNIDWLKIDVEGQEEAVLRGARRTIGEHRPRILVECHQFMDDQIQRRVWELVMGWGIGYTCEGPVPYHAVSHCLFVPT